ncbi:DUF2892 domain-containing protein [Bacillus spongiae]|uniref:DUF2892 domain-containing protein n=1 Tax=Bacillus spongiae TaxID=2683610 RepID=A0ABU8HDR7_9BACI
MKVSPNIGIINALIRITIGFTLLAWSTAKLSKKPWRESYLLVAMCAGMKIGEGILKYCPVTALFEKGAPMLDDKKLDLSDMIEKFTEKAEQKQETEQDGPDIPYNPS